MAPMVAALLAQAASKAIDGIGNTLGNVGKDNPTPPPAKEEEEGEGLQDKVESMGGLVGSGEGMGDMGDIRALIEKFMAGAGGAGGAAKAAGAAVI